MAVADIVMSVVMYAVSGVMISQMGKIKSPDSRIFPIAIVVLLIFFATLLLLITLFGKKKAKYDFTNTARGMKLMGMLLVFAICTYYFGFYSCVAFFIFGAMYFLGQRNKLLLILVPVVMAVVMAVLFDVLFNANLPVGALFDPYDLIFH